MGYPIPSIPYTLYPIPPLVQDAGLSLLGGAVSGVLIQAAGHGQGGAALSPISFMDLVVEDSHVTDAPIPAAAATTDATADDVGTSPTAAASESEGAARGDEVMEAAGTEAAAGGGGTSLEVGHDTTGMISELAQPWL